MISCAVREVRNLRLRPWHVERGAEVVGALPVFAWRYWWLVVDSYVPVKIRLVAGSVLADMADKRLLSSVDLLVTVQQSLSHKTFSTSWPLARVSCKNNDTFRLN